MRSYVGGTDDYLRFEVNYPKEKVKELMKSFRREASRMVAAEIKKVFQEEKNNAKNRLKRHGSQGITVGVSLGVEQQVSGDTSETMIASFDYDGTPTGVKGSRGVNLAEMLEDGMSEFIYAFKSAAAWEHGRPIEATGDFKALGFDSWGLPAQTLHRHPGFPRTDWLSKTAERIEEKLNSDRIPRKLAQAFVTHAKKKGAGY